jgi:hypothetical protein
VTAPPFAPAPRYDHRQDAWWMRISFLGIDAVVFGALLASAVEPAVLAIAGAAAALILAVGWGFSSLRVVVDATTIHLAFGFGWPRKAIPLAQVTSAAPVRNRWWWGFGIRYTPDGWMWNASGLDAVAVARAPGRSFRIGTDDPDGLTRAILAARSGAAAA